MAREIEKMPADYNIGAETMLDRLTAAALTGILANPSLELDAVQVARRAAMYARATLFELNERWPHRPYRRTPEEERQVQFCEEEALRRFDESMG